MCAACSLALKLKTAQVSRERSLQLQERGLLAQQEAEYAALRDVRLERERAAAERAEAAKQQERRLDNIHAREKLQVRLPGGMRRRGAFSWAASNSLTLKRGPARPSMLHFEPSVDARPIDRAAF